MPYTTRGTTMPTPGSDANTWGGLINDEMIPELENLVKGVEAISLTGNKTLTNTNGDIDAEARNMWMVFADGGLSSQPTVTIPGTVQSVFMVTNSGSTYAITFSAGGTTADLAAGRTGILRSDGTDCVVWDPVAASVGNADIIAVSNNMADVNTVADNIADVQSAAVAVDGLQGRTFWLGATL